MIKYEDLTVKELDVEKKNIILEINRLQKNLFDLKEVYAKKTALYKIGQRFTWIGVHHSAWESGEITVIFPSKFSSGEAKYKISPHKKDGTVSNRKIDFYPNEWKEEKP